jgi:hypothetical protein
VILGEGITPDRIYQLYVTRKNKNMKVIQAGEMIRKVYNGEWETVLPELEKRERVQVANLVNQGIEQDAMRIASVMPNILFPPERNSRPARERAQDRRQVIIAWHFINKMPQLFRQRARYLIAYGTSPVYVRPGEEMIPRWELWDPLSTFAAPTAPNEMVPSDAIYHFKRSWKWLQDTYDLGKRLPLGEKASPDSMVDCLLYCDASEMTMIAINKDGDGEQVANVLLQRVPNLSGRPCVIVPSRITLDRLMGQFDQMIGMYEAQGLLWAMHLQAIKRSIFPETWLQGIPNAPGPPSIIRPANALTGEVGEVENGQIVNYRADPSVQTGQTLDRLERNQRQTGGIPAELGGESATNIRTARRGQQVMSSAIDFPIQEHQDLLAASLQEEDYVAIATAKAYHPNTEKTLLVPFGDGQVVYTPAETFVVDTHSVEYTLSGTSADGLVIEGLQRVGAGLLSDESWMEMDPLVQDPITEMARITGEQIRKALIQSIQQQAADPNSPYQPDDIAWLLMEIEDKKVDLPAAVANLHKRLQDRQNQASQGQLSDQQMQPGLSQPGAPGTPQAAIPAQGPQPTPDQQGLAALMGSLRNTQRGVVPAGQTAPPRPQAVPA